MVSDLRVPEQNQTHDKKLNPFVARTAHGFSSSQPLSFIDSVNGMRPPGVSSRLLLAALDHSHAGGHLSHRHRVKGLRPNGAPQLYGASCTDPCRPLVADDLSNLARGL